MFVCRN